MRMDTITRDVRDLSQAERSALERIIGHELRETQRVIVKVIDVDSQVPSEYRPQDASGVPPWWKVYEGLSDEEVDRLDEAVRQRADLTRTFA
jgi:hypothetical protein